MKRALGVAAAFSLASAAVAQPDPLVRITVDMDASRPGIQNSVVVAPGETVVRGVAVYIFSVEGSPSMLSLGFVGGLDRGLVFGHAPGTALRGSVASMTAHPGTAIYPNGPIELLTEQQCCVQPWFEGPEIHYLEFGGNKLAPIPRWPAPPVYTVDIALNEPRVGDVYSFHLLDGVAAWGVGGIRGMFTTETGYYLNTGGDATPDGTPTPGGEDLDDPAPIPPATFLVDIVDGPPAIGGGATIHVVCTADFDHDGSVNSADFFTFVRLFFMNDPSTDFNRDGHVDSQDFFDFLGAFFAGCG